ncbi:hypothetical protein NRK67_15830 [Fusobacteria bacterium ZRK30]|nr:hypothetical protein NRK67_15830 [Fusobacteria bacterium ZRK30]
MNKKLLLLAGILALGATTFAAHTPAGEEAVLTAEKAAEISTITSSSTIEGLVIGRQEGENGFSGSYAGEVLVGMQQGPGRSAKATNGNYKISDLNYVTTTLGKGKLNMGKLGFIYDVDRDTNFDKNWNKTNEGWDTSFGLDYQGGTFDMMGKEWTFVPGISYGYDTAENFTSKHVDHGTAKEKGDYEKKRLTTITAKISTTYYGFATDYVANVGYDDVEGTVASQFIFSNFRKLNDSWTTYGDVYLDVAGTKNDKVKKGTDTYSNDLFEGSIDEDNKYDVTIYQTLGYEKEIAKNLYFINEIGIEFYSVLSSEGTGDIFVLPELQYRAKVSSFDVVPYVNYAAYSANVDDESRNELNLGVRFGTKF